jgi:hypothetical protein
MYIYINIHIYHGGAVHTRITSIFSGNGDSRLRERPMRGAGSVSRGEKGRFFFLDYTLACTRNTDDIAAIERAYIGCRCGV